MDDPSRIYDFPIYRGRFVDCRIHQSAVDQLATGIEVSRHPLVETSARYFVVEGEINVVHHNLKHFGHPPRISPEVMSRHCRERGALHEMKKVDDETFLTIVYMGAPCRSHHIWNPPSRMQLDQVVAVHTKPPVAVVSFDLSYASPAVWLKSMSPSSKDCEVFGSKEAELDMGHHPHDPE